MRPFFVLLLGALALSSCQKPPESDPAREADKNYQHIESSDVLMNNAITTAKKTSNQFLEAFRHPKPSYHDFFLKKPYVIRGDSQEHMWIGNLREAGDHFEGTIANEADETKEVVFGQAVTVKLDEISDWKYMDGKHLIGGYTIRYFYDRMNPAEKKSFLEENGLEMD